ncbi:MAG: amidohydrolase [Candidatus Parabeggiatoa sp.]|nr:amidohydrolase [Candidatus Parabeggiatoa sp.]
MPAQKRRYTPFWLMGVVLVNLFVSPTTASTKTVADLILHDGLIYTVNKAQPWAESLAVKASKIIFVGSNSEVAQYQGKKTRIIELEKRMVLPGFHDSHLHPLEAGSEVGTTCDLTGLTQPNDFIDAILQCAPYQVGTDWILGGGHAIATLFDWLDQGQLPIDILDQAISDRPVAMMEETSHSLWINSVAWAKFKAEYGFDIHTHNVPGGLIYRDETGQFTGILFENAGNMVLDIAFASSETLKALTYEGLLWSLKTLAQNGITSIADARTYWKKRGHLDVWKQAEKNGDLTARTVLGLWAYPHYDDAEQIKQLTALYDNNPESLLRVSQVKVYSDGILGNGTAALLQPYSDDRLGIIPDNKGLNYFDEKRLTQYVTVLEKAGFDMHIHTIGDRAVREALNAIETAQKLNGLSDRRHRLTHLEMIDPADRPRFAKLGVIADFQLAGEFTEPALAEAENYEAIGERALELFPVKSLYDSGATITLSSDWDVSQMSPFLGIERAVKLGKLPNLDAAIQAYTLNAAFLMRQEQLTGSIEKGKVADLIVLDQDIFKTSVDKIDETTVLLTLLGGKVVYSHPKFCDDSQKGRFSSNTLHLPEVDAISLGTYATDMELLDSEPQVSFKLHSAEPVKASGSPCTAHFNEMSGKLFIPVVQVGQKVLSADLVRENLPNVYRFTLAFQHDITPVE